MKRVVLLLTCLLISALSFGQKADRFSSESEAFIQDLGKFIKDSKNQKAKDEFVNFESFWKEGRLSASNQKRFVKVSNKIAKQKYQANPHFFQLMRATRVAIDSQMVSADVMDTLMLTIVKVSEEYKRPQYEYFFRTIIPFLERNTLNNGKYNDILAKGKFKIVWREELVPVEPEESEEEEPEEEVISAEEAWAEEEESDDGDDWGSWDDWDESANEDSWDTQDAWGESSVENQEEEEVVEEPVIIGYIPPEIPTIKGPVIEFETVDFGFVSKYDSVAIKGSKGTFLITDRKVVAEGGTFDWSSAGLSKAVQGTFKQFVFPTNKIYVEAEGFTLNYDEKIEAPVEGVFEFSSVKHRRPLDARYPRFMSYNNDVTIKDLGEDIEYLGGFSLNGHKVYSSCVSLAKSKITVRKNGEKKFEAHAHYFELGDSIVRSNPTSVTIYFDQDSIYHPSVELKYNRSTENLAVYKHESKFEQTAYVDTYHNVDINVDKISWTLSDSLMYMDILRGRKAIMANFTSVNYFSERDYVHLKGLYPFHPLQLLIAYAEKKNKTKFYLEKLVKYSRQNKSALQHAMVDMMRMGLIEYDVQTTEIKILPKAQYCVDARKHKVDYDVIAIPSLNPDGHNAVLNLSDYSLEVRGVDSVYFSDSLDVNFHPKNRKMKILKNRTFLFDGAVNTSIYNFNGRDFTFDYDLFNIDLVHIDSIKFQIDTEDSITGRKTGEKQIDNKLTYSSGTLYIDSLINKSSQQSFPKFPYFDANRGAYVFFDQDYVLGGAYDTTFYFHIPPFGSDSMSSNSGKSVTFEGRFVSAGIFPEFDYTLGVMSDYSFGFDYVIPEEGYPLYGGNGRFHGAIRLDKNGLRGDGYLDFLNTRVESSDFVFYIDSVMAVGQSCVTVRGGNALVAEGVGFPPVEVADFEMRWLPKKDSMFVKNLIEPFNMYDSSANLEGTIIITHDGLKGEGIYKMGASRTVSKLFHFEERRLQGRKAEFEILSDTPGKPAVRSDYVKVDFELDSGIAVFSPEKVGYAANEFPYLQYKSSLDEGKWDMNAHVVSMSVPENSDIADWYFYSTNPEQDSIAFNARSAVYSIDSLSLHVMGVPEVLVADGKIIPGGNELFIRENAYIVPLHDAEIILDTVGEFHHLVEGDILIESKNKFSGKAKYAYKNIQGDTLFIEFNQFDLVDVEVSKKEVQQHTFSQGIVAVEDSFLIAPKMYYQGDASMYANKKKLRMDGAIRLDLYGEVPSPNWLHYLKVDDVDSVIISTKGQVTTSGSPTLTGVHFSKARKDYYVSLLGQKGGSNDFTIFKADGICYYDQKHNEFLLGDSLRMLHEHYEGNLFAYEPDLERVSIQGLIDIFGHPTTEEVAMDPSLENEHPVEVKIAGKGDMYLLDDKFDIKGLAFVKFDYDPKALDVMGTDLAQMTRLFMAPPAYQFNDTIAFEIADIAGEAAAEKLKENPSVPLPKIVKQFGEGVVLTDVHLEWSKEQKAWYSKDSIGIGSIGKHTVNAMVNGMLEIRKGKGYEYKVNLYLELNERSWYYLSFEKNRLLTGSSNTNYTAIVAAKNTRARNEPMGAYFFDVAPPSKKKKFRNRFIRTYRDGEGLEDDVMELELDMNAFEADSLSQLQDEEDLMDDEEDFLEDDSFEDDEFYDETEEQAEDLEDEIFEEMQDEEEILYDEESMMDDEEQFDDELTDEDLGIEEEEPNKKDKKKKKSKKERKAKGNAEDQGVDEDDLEDEIMEE